MRGCRRRHLLYSITTQRCASSNAEPARPIDRTGEPAGNVLLTYAKCRRVLTKRQQTVQVDKQVLVVLTQESLEKTAGIQRLEDAATELYKALQAGRERGELCATYD